MRYLHIAVKNMTRQKRRSILLAGAIAFGVLVIILIGALSDGILDSFVNRQASAFTGHVVVNGLVKNDRGNMVSYLENDDPVFGVVNETFPDETRIIPRTSGFGTFINGSESRQQIIMGIDPGKEQDLLDLLILDQGEFLSSDNPAGIILSKEIAEALQVVPGDSLMVKLKTIQGVNNVGDFILTGIISGDLGTMSTMAAFANRAYLNSFMGMNAGSFTELDIFFKSGKTSEDKAKTLHGAMTGQGFQMLERPEDTKLRGEIRLKASMGEWEGVKYSITSIEENFQFVFVISNFLNILTMVIMLVLLGIILVGLANTLRMTIFERRKEIGTMRALGMQKGSLVLTFLTEVMLTALTGIAAGSLLALIAGSLIAAIPLDIGHTFIALFLYNKHLLIKFSLQRFISTSGIFLAAVMFAAYFPARKSAKIGPAVAMRSTT